MHLIYVRRETFDVMAGGPALRPYYEHTHTMYPSLFLSPNYAFDLC